MQAKKEHESKMLSFALKKVSDIFGDYSLSHSEDRGSVENFVSYIANRAEEEKAVCLSWNAEQNNALVEEAFIHLVNSVISFYIFDNCFSFRV